MPHASRPEHKKAKDESSSFVTVPLSQSQSSRDWIYAFAEGDAPDILQVIEGDLRNARHANHIKLKWEDESILKRKRRRLLGQSNMTRRYVVVFPQLLCFFSSINTFLTLASTHYHQSFPSHSEQDLFHIFLPPLSTVSLLLYPSIGHQIKLFTTTRSTRPTFTDTHSRTRQTRSFNHFQFINLSLSINLSTCYLPQGSLLLPYWLSPHLRRLVPSRESYFRNVSGLSALVPFI